MPLPSRRCAGHFSLFFTVLGESDYHKHIVKWSPASWNTIKIDENETQIKIFAGRPVARLVARGRPRAGMLSKTSVWGLSLELFLAFHCTPKQSSPTRLSPKTVLPLPSRLPIIMCLFMETLYVVLIVSFCRFWATFRQLSVNTRPWVSLPLTFRRLSVKFPSTFLQLSVDFPTTFRLTCQTCQTYQTCLTFWGHCFLKKLGGYQRSRSIRTTPRR